MATALHSARTRFFDKCGNPLCGGTVYTYQVGTTTAKPTYTDVSKTAVNTNPVILDSIGSAAIFLDGAYRVRVLDRCGVLVEDIQFIESWISATEKEAIYQTIDDVDSVLTEHIANTANPHEVSKVQIGLGNVDNTADLDKPVSAPAKTYIDQQDALKADKATTYTKTEVDSKVNAVSGGYIGAFATLSELNAKTGMTTGQVAKVMNDTTTTNNGDYRYTGSAWVKGYDNSAEAKSYADAQDVTVLTNAKSYADAQDATTLTNAKTYADNAVLNAPFAAALHVNSDTTNTREVLIADKTGNGVLAYDTTTKKLIGNFDTKPTYTAKTINHFLFYGQSLSIGGGQSTIISTTQPYNNLTFTGGVDGGGNLDLSGTKPLVSRDASTAPYAIDGRGDRGETPVSGACNAASLFAYRDSGVDPANFPIFGSTAGKGGTVIDLLDKGEDWYNNKFLAHIWGAYKLSNGSYGLPCVGWLQGESDLDASTPIDYATYKAKLSQLRDDVQDYVYSLCNQRYPVFFLTYQLSHKIKTSDSVARAQFDLDRDNEFFGLVVPTYVFPPNGDGAGHLTPVGYKWIGAYFGRAFKQVVFDKIKPKGIKPLSAVKNGTTITVKFSAPQLPLKFDTTTLAATTNQGFAVYDSTGANLALASVTVSNDTVMLTLAADNTNPLTVKYAYDYLPSSVKITNGAMGNLVDSTTDSVVISGTSYPMFYAAPHFTMPVKKLEI